MEAKIPIEQNELAQWLDTLTVPVYREMKKEIITKCRITDQIFRHWKSGNTSIPVLAKEKINEIADEEVFKLEN